MVMSGQETVHLTEKPLQSRGIYISYLLLHRKLPPNLVIQGWSFWNGRVKLSDLKQHLLSRFLWVQNPDMASGSGCLTRPWSRCQLGPQSSQGLPGEGTTSQVTPEVVGRI